MATTLIPEASRPSPLPTGNNVRFVAIRANLMPDEVLSARQADVVRRRVLIALAALVAVLIAGYGFSWLQTKSARGDLADQQHQTTALQTQQQAYAPLVQVQTRAQAIQTQLRQLMVGDLSWTAMLTTLRAKAPAGVTLTQISGTITTGAASVGAVPVQGGYGALNQTGQQQVGTIALTGTAPDKRTVAAYADSLAKVKGLAAPFITSVAAAGGNVTFTATVIVTAQALGGRYAAPATPTTIPTANATTNANATTATTPQPGGK